MWFLTNLEFYLFYLRQSRLLFVHRFPGRDTPLVGRLTKMCSSLPKNKSLAVTQTSAKYLLTAKLLVSRTKFQKHLWI